MKKIGIKTLYVRGPKASGRGADWRDGSTKWRVILSRDGYNMAIDYYTGSGHGKNPPKLTDVLYCLASDAASVQNADGFESWAADMGFNPDSWKDEKIFNAVVEQSEKFENFMQEDFHELLELDREQINAMFGVN